jgi:hypothetical protein
MMMMVLVVVLLLLVVLLLPYGLPLLLYRVLRQLPSRHTLPLLPC